MAQGGHAKPGRRNYTPRRRVLDKQGAQDRMVELLQNGMTVRAALEKVGRGQKWWELQRREDPDFKARADSARALRKIDRTAIPHEHLGFAEWRRKYLGRETYWHQLQWVDMIEGREPRDLHEAQTYSKGKRSRLLVLTPPFHAKSMTLTVDYSAYRLCMDPSFRILAVSASSTLAKDFLFSVKQILTSPDYLELQKAYAPDGGWEATAESWTEDRIVFGTDVRAKGSGNGKHEKDPNFQALGIRGHIYGKRADLIFVDDGVDGNNVREWEKQMKWLRREVSSRLEMGGKLVVVGTRIAPVDLYSELMNPDHYASGRVPWTHLASPAILEEGGTPQQHVTLWPYADQSWVSGNEDDDECDCGTQECSVGFERDGVRLYPRWDGLHLEIGPRADNNATEWALVYQQTAVSEYAVFPQHAVERSTNVRRMPGVLQPDKPEHPVGGMHNMYVVGGLDPAVKGWAGMVVVAVDRDTGKRFLLNAWNIKAPTPRELKERMREVTVHYQVDEWRVERTGLLQFFTQDDDLRSWFATRGVVFSEHFTGTNKWDSTFGVASMSPLFGQWTRATGSHGEPTTEWEAVTDPLLELPRPMVDGVKALIHQLVTWTPETDPTRTPCDMVMALWFAEIRAREIVSRGRGGTVTPLRRTNRFVSPRAQNSRYSVNVADARAGQFAR